MKNLTIVDHPLIQHKLTELRKISTPTNQFRKLLREISLLLAYEITRSMPMTMQEIATPLEKYPTLMKHSKLISEMGTVNEYLNQENPCYLTVPKEEETNTATN